MYMYMYALCNYKPNICCTIHCWCFSPKCSYMYKYMYMYWCKCCTLYHWHIPHTHHHYQHTPSLPAHTIICTHVFLSTYPYQHIVQWTSSIHFVLLHKAPPLPPPPSHTCVCTLSSGQLSHSTPITLGGKLGISMTALVTFSIQE